MQRKQNIFKKLTYSAIAVLLCAFLVEFLSIVVEKSVFRISGKKTFEPSPFREYSNFCSSKITKPKIIKLTLPEIDFEIDRPLYEVLNNEIKQSGLAQKMYEVKGPRFREKRRSLFFFGDSVTASIEPALLDLDVINKLKIRKIYNMGRGGENSTWGEFLIRNLLEDPQSRIIGSEDIVFISYVWNDHWTRLRINRVGKHVSPLYNYLLKSHFVRLYSYVYYRFIYSGSNLECPPEIFKKNYNSIIEKLKEKDVRVILWTAPTTLINLEIPLYYLEDGNARPTSNVLAIHDKYNELLRTIAKNNDVELFDLAKYFKEIPWGKAMPYMNDTIHFSGEGSLWFMAEISKYLSMHEKE